MTPQERIDATMRLISQGIPEGEHHTAWMFDQIVRILTDCPTVTRTNIDVHGDEYTYDPLGESDAYRRFVTEYEDGEDGPETYTWDEGIAP